MIDPSGSLSLRTWMVVRPLQIANLPLIVLQHIRTSHMSMLQTRELLTLHSGSQNFPDPQFLFNIDIIQLEELQFAIKKSKHSSSPSPFDQILYSIIKKCPALLPALLDIYNYSWHTHDIPTAWNRASITLIPKSKAEED